MSSKSSLATSKKSWACSLRSGSSRTTGPSRVTGNSIFKGNEEVMLFIVCSFNPRRGVPHLQPEFAKQVQCISEDFLHHYLASCPVSRHLINGGAARCGRRSAW